MRRGLGRQRARREAGVRLVDVVAARRGVVRPVRVEQRGEQLDLAAADAQLAHAAAVGDQAPLLGEGVDVEQRPQVADAARLDVERHRRERHGVDVGGGVDRRVVGDAVRVRREQLRDLREVVRVLEQRVRERGDHALVHGEQLRQLGHVEPVLALEVDDLDGLRRGDLGDQLRRPGRDGVELEAQAGVAVEPDAQRRERRRIAQAERVDEADRAGLAAEDLVQRLARLVERQVERGGLERPVAPAARDVPLRRHRPLVELVQALAQRAEGPLAGQRQHGAGGVQRGRLVLVGRHVLAQPLVALAAQVDHVGLALEVVRLPHRQPLDLVGLDAQRERAQLVPHGHAIKDSASAR